VTYTRNYRARVAYGRDVNTTLGSFRVRNRGAEKKNRKRRTRNSATPNELPVHAYRWYTHGFRTICLCKLPNGKHDNSILKRVGRWLCFSCSTLLLKVEPLAFFRYSEIERQRTKASAQRKTDKFPTLSNIVGTAENTYNTDGHASGATKSRER